MPETTSIDSTKVRLSATVYPRQDAETVVLLHGGPGVPMDFSPIARQLSGEYQVVAFDQRGTGRSPVEGATYSLEAYFGDIDAVARHLGVERFHLFGHSWGGGGCTHRSMQRDAREVS